MTSQDSKENLLASKSLKSLVILVGDGPSQLSGLGRIARGLAEVWAEEAREAGIVDFLQIGMNERISYGHPWPVVPAQDIEAWGSETLFAVLQRAKDCGVKRVGIFTVWDPGRCHDIAGCVKWVREAKWFERLLLWGYFAIDAEGPYARGGFGGPAAEALEQYAEIIPYTKFGQRVLNATVERRIGGNVVDHLPHWLEPDWWKPVGDAIPEELTKTVPGIAKWLDEGGEGVPVWGCVATNQPRKDLSLLFLAALHYKQRHGHLPKLWLHTDYLMAAWSVPELAEIAGYDKSKGLGVLVTGAAVSKKYPCPTLTDESLRWLYAQCGWTIAPGLGEGWGYPLVESLACGVGVVHGIYGGGAEVLQEATRYLVSTTAQYSMVWQPAAPAYYRYEGIYALRRPVFDAGMLLVGSALDPDACRLAAECFSRANVRPRWEAKVGELIHTLLS